MIFRATFLRGVIRRLWAKHDRLEREIIRVERIFSEQELDEILNK